MIVMLDTPEDLDVAAGELGCEVEQLLTPLTRRKRQKPECRFTIDNGAFAKFNPSGFLSLLERNADDIDLCRWVAVPDVVGSAIRSIEVFNHWKTKISRWPLAFVCQDGQESLPIPWDEIVAVFIGGTDDFKLGRHGAACVKAAKALGKWVHVGRVNTPGRLEYFEDLGADSCDGTGLARYSHMRAAIYENARQPKLI
jgi:hypothetical protein